MHYKPHVLFSVEEVGLMHALQASCVVLCRGGGANECTTSLMSYSV